jgi:glyoxylase-like metal-dependent hydrolase (beta-lactamase superfamily II)
LQATTTLARVHSHDQPVTPRPKRQEAEDAGDEITEVAPGVLRVQLPIMGFPGLGHVNCYVLEDERGFAVVDPGMMGKDNWKRLETRLAAAGAPLKRIHTAVVTHSHPDHFGGAGFLHHESGADIVSHRYFRTWWDPTEPPDVSPEELPPVESPVGRQPWGGAGMNIPFKRKAMLKARRIMPGLFRAPRPTVRLDDAQRFKLARREWIAVHTPGHTADHLCLYDPEYGTLISGDHVLPTITPHISGISKGDPLQAFFTSLDKVAAFTDARMVLPAHGHPFTDLAGRVADIKDHHVGRLELLRTASHELGRPATVPEMSTYLFSQRAQGAMADSETYAHLEHMRRIGQAERSEREGNAEYLIS